MMATLYDVGLPTINEHIKKIIAVGFKVNNERAVQFRNPRSIQIFWDDLTSRRMEVSYG